MDSIDFPPGDLENPRNWPEWRKWSIVAIIIPIDLTVSWAASGFSPGSSQFSQEFHVSSEVATLGLSLTVLGFALAPLVQAPLSEYFGRSPLYIASYGIFLFFLLGTPLVHNLGGFLVLRLLAGLFCSVTIANFGGTISDLWVHNETGLPMSLFLWAATCGSPSGYFLFAFIAQTRGWRTVFWALLGICGGLWIILILVLKETRHTTILRKRVKSKLKSSGRQSLDPTEIALLEEHRSAKDLFRLALSRPLRFLFTEAIVTFCALYNGYLYGLSFLFNEAFSLVFGHGHGFSTISVGLAFLGIITGISFGPLTNLWQERYYQRRTGGDPRVNIPEARVQLGQVAAVGESQHGSPRFYLR
jgi:MFS family permease